MSDSGTPLSAGEQNRRAAAISDFLPSGYGTGFDGIIARGSTPDLVRSAGPDDEEPTEESSLLLHGGDIHRELYKINARERAPSIRRAQTFSYPNRAAAGGGGDDDESIIAREGLLQPQGFRRQFVIQKHGGLSGRDVPIARDFIEFLDLYGAFAGEDLADSDDEAIDDSEMDDDDEHEGGGGGLGDSERQRERRPLLDARRKSSRVLRKTVGDAGNAKTFFTLLKAFVGTGIMFLPKAFKNGGILFSSLTLVSIAVVSMVAFHLLLECRARFGGGYGEIGREIAGPRMRTLILGSIAISQLGFVCTGLVFVADNWFSFLKAVSGGASPLSSTALIAVQAVILVPLTLIRNISKLGPAALLADVFIVIGVGYIWFYDISVLSEQGIHPSVRLFNPAAYTLTIGASIFTFEGIGLILPIQSSMKQPQHFEKLLGLVMLLITCIFTSVGALCYATFGSETKIEVIDNFPQTSRLVNAVQFLYALAVLVGNPVQLFPAQRILEGKIFGHRSGKKDLLTKWKKNVFRTLLVAVCIAVSIGGSANLDRFVALIGSFACVPLVYIYPPYLHLRGVATTRGEKALDLGLIVLGTFGMIFSTTVTLLQSFL